MEIVFILRQFDPAFVVAPAAAVAWSVDDDREVAVEPTGAGGFLVVDEELPPNEFEFARAIEVLAGQADLAVEFVKLKHDGVNFSIQRTIMQSSVFIVPKFPGCLEALFKETFAFFRLVCRVLKITPGVSPA